MTETRRKKYVDCNKYKDREYQGEQLKPLLEKIESNLNCMIGETFLGNEDSFRAHLEKSIKILLEIQLRLD